MLGRDAPEGGSGGRLGGRKGVPLRSFETESVEPGGKRVG